LQEDLAKAEEKTHASQIKVISESSQPINVIEDKIKVEPLKAKPVFSENTREFLDRELSKSKLSVLTLQTLPHALLALDKEGQELFLNEDWFNLRKTYGDSLNSKPLLSSAKDTLAERVLHQNEDEFSTFEVKKDIKDFVIFCRPIKEIKEINGDTIIKTVGYLFWGEKVKKTNYSKQIEKMDILRSKIESNYSTLSQSFRGSSFEGKTLPDILGEHEKKVLLWALEQTDGNKTDAAMIIGIPRQTFSYRLNKYLKKEERKKYRD